MKLWMESTSMASEEGEQKTMGKWLIATHEVASPAIT